MGVTKYFNKNGGEINPRFIQRDIKGVRLQGVAGGGVFTFPTPEELYKPIGHQIHFFEEMTFSANVSSEAFQKSIGANIPSISIYHDKISQPVTNKPIDLNQYFNGLTIGMNHIPNSKNTDFYKLKVNGEIYQSPSILADLGGNDLYINFMFTIVSIPLKQYNLTFGME